MIKIIYMKNFRSIAVAVIFSIAAFSFYQCTNDEGLFSGFEYEPDFANLQEVHDIMNQNDTVQFTIDDLSIENNFTGPKGIRLFFPENSCTIGAGDPALPIVIQLIEVFRRGEIVSHNMQTYANQTALVSGGIFWLTGKDANGNPVNFNNVKAIIPYKTDADGYEYEMLHHTGTTQTKPSGMINSWNTGGAAISFDEEAGVNGEFAVGDVVSGWNGNEAPYNFDEEGDEATQFTVQVSNSSGLEKTEVFWLSDEYTLVSGIPNVEGGAFSTYNASVPKGAEGKLIAIALVDGKLNFSTQNVTVNGDDNFVIEVAPGDISELMALLNSLN